MAARVCEKSFLFSLISSLDVSIDIEGVCARRCEVLSGSNGARINCAAMHVLGFLFTDDQLVLKCIRYFVCDVIDYFDDFSRPFPSQVLIFSSFNGCF